MMQATEITGYWYPANSSACYDAKLHTDGAHYTLNIADNDSQQGHIADLSVSHRVGNIPRKITLPDHSTFETQANEQVDHLLRKTNHRDGNLHFLHVLETHWRWIATALVLTVLVSFSSVYWGLPWASEKLAYAMPIGVSESISKGSLDIMDDYVLQPSELSTARQQKIREHFQTVLLSTQSEDFNYQLLFRQFKGIPNQGNRIE